MAIVAGALCVIVPNVHTLIELHALQGMGGAAGVVLSRAIITDSTADEVASAHLFQLIMIIGGLAPVLAPVVGTGIVTLFGWRAIFAAIAMLSLVALIGVVFLIDESLPEERRTTDGACHECRYTAGTDKLHIVCASEQIAPTTVLMQ